ncbi:MAG TPA: hypothetical protein VL527_14915 [Dongiaceae bacterium]|nr:hypothetical protein [Dongiaceae bacterium]
MAQDVAYCRECNLSHRLSELTYDQEINASLDLQHPPPGAWYITNGGGTVIGATNRNLGMAIGTLFFALFWNGIVSVFVVLAIAGTLHNLHIPLPGWFPAPKMDGENMSPGMAAFLWLFLTPFIVIGLTVAGTCLTCLFGRTEARLERPRAILFTGVGSLGWKRTFDVSEVKDVRLHEQRSNEGNNRVSILIETRTGKQLKLGSLLTSERRQFVLGALRKSLLK